MESSLSHLSSSDSKIEDILESILPQRSDLSLNLSEESESEEGTELGANNLSSDVSELPMTDSLGVPSPINLTIDIPVETEIEKRCDAVQADAENCNEIGIGNRVAESSDVVNFKGKRSNKNSKRSPYRTSPPLCKFFLQGRCRFGSRCYNLHPRSQEGIHSRSRHRRSRYDRDRRHDYGQYAQNRNNSTTTRRNREYSRSPSRSRDRSCTNMKRRVQRDDSTTAKRKRREYSRSPSRSRDRSRTNKKRRVH